MSLLCRGNPPHIASAARSARRALGGYARLRYLLDVARRPRVSCLTQAQARRLPGPRSCRSLRSQRDGFPAAENARARGRRRRRARVRGDLRALRDRHRDHVRVAAAAGSRDAATDRGGGSRPRVVRAGGGRARRGLCLRRPVQQACCLPLVVRSERVRGARAAAHRSRSRVV